MGKTILHGGRVYRNGCTVPTSVGISEGRIVGVGQREDLRSMLGGDVKEVDMEGTCLLPGFVEGHCHLVSLGHHLETVDLQGCESIQQLQKRLRDRAQMEPPGTWILGRGWDQDFFADRRYPTAVDLDVATEKHPVLLHRNCGWVACANTFALQEAGLATEDAEADHEHIERDAQGNPTGLVREKAINTILEAVPQTTREDRRGYLQRAVDHCLSRGITSAHTNDHEDSLWALASLYREVCGPGGRGFRAYLDVPYDFLHDAEQLGVITGSGDEWVRLGATKLYADGSLGARSAALSRDYADDAGNRGRLVTPPTELQRRVERAQRLGMQVALHAIGDRGLDSAMDALEAADHIAPRPDPRHRLVHCQITREDQFSRLAQGSHVAAIQPIFVRTDMRWATERIGEELARTSYAWRRMLQEGIVCAGGSDAPVEPIAPALGIWAAVTRTDDAGHPADGWMPEQKVSIREAIQMFTHDSAYAEFSEGEKGCIRRGALADLACLDRDPTAVDPEELADVQVVETWVGGRPAYSKR